MHTMNDKGPWMWLSWQSGCFRHQRSTVWNPLSAKFILNVVSCQLYWKDENNKKIKAGNGPFFNNELHEWQARSAKTLVKLKLEVIPIWVVDNTKPRDLRSVWHDKIIGELPEGNPTIYDIIHYLSNLLKLERYIYNRVKYQDEDSYVYTCGAHSCHKIYRLINNNMNLEQYHEFMKNLKDESKINYDLIVATFIQLKLKD